MTRKINKTKNRIWLRLALLIILIGGFTLLFYETGLVHYFIDKERVLRFLKFFGPFSFIGFILLQALQVVISPIPGEVTGLLGGYLYGPVLGVFLSTLGLTLGSYIAFSLSRAFGRPFVERFVNKETIARFDYLLHHRAAFLVFLLFLIPGFPKDYLCYILGLGHLTTIEFLIIGGIGRLFGTILLTLGGSYIKHHQYGRFSILAGVAILVVLVALAYRDKIERLLRRWHIYQYYKKRREKKKSQL